MPVPSVARVILAEKLAALPGITVNQILTAAGLPKHEDDNVGKLTLNLPGRV